MPGSRVFGHGEGHVLALVGRQGHKDSGHSGQGPVVMIGRFIQNLVAVGRQSGYKAEGGGLDVTGCQNGSIWLRLPVLSVMSVIELNGYSPARRRRVEGIVFRVREEALRKCGIDQT